MFDFNDDKLTTEQILEEAAISGLPVLRVAINANGYRQSASLWPELFSMKDFEFDAGTIKAIEIIVNQGKSSKGVIGVRALYERARKVKLFKSRIGVMQELKEVIIPKLDEIGYTCLIGDKIYINPRLIEAEPFWLKVKPLEDDFNVGEFMNEVDEAQLKVIREAIGKLKAQEKYLLTGK